ncbi:MAG: hypothetical protein HC794_05220 [Nitrospiraceae bacterium]|nr:hypothetical protein [Nitrospiraceae bacterium]
MSSLVVGWTVYLAELYGLCQFCFFTYQSWSPTDRQPAPITNYPTVDIMVTVVDEPLSLLRQTLMGCLSLEYPRDRFNVYVLDDGRRLEAKKMRPHWDAAISDARIIPAMPRREISTMRYA